MSLLATAVLVGLAASGVTFIVRALVPQMWLLHKPLACDLCMSWWSALAVTGWSIWCGDVGLSQSVVAVLGGVGVSVLAVKTANRLAT